MLPERLAAVQELIVAYHRTGQIELAEKVRLLSNALVPAFDHLAALLEVNLVSSLSLPQT